MGISKLKKLSLAVSLAMMPLSTYAAGLGKLNVTSSLGEPFSAEIDLISTTPTELETLTAVIASEEAYLAQGISRLGIHNDISVTVANSAGRPKLLLKSSNVVNDPYLDMLIQLDWASGRLQREYTVLLDPPGYKDSIATPSANTLAPVATMAEPVAPQPVPVMPEATYIDSNEGFTSGTSALPDPSMPIPANIFPEDQAVNNVSAGAKSEAEIEAEIRRIEQQARANVGLTANPVVKSTPSKTPKRASQKITSKKTVSGDSLSKIAQRMRVSGVSLNQMLVGLYENNKDAFVDGNMNRLKVGKVIKLPSRAELTAVTRSAASQTVALHTDDWKAYRNGLASSITTSNNMETKSEKQVESGVITAVEPEKDLKPTETKDVVKLSAGEQAKSNKDKNLDAQAKKEAEAEDATATEKALAEAKDRTKAVEKQIEDMQKLLAMKSQAMEDLQSKAETNNAVSEVEKAETEASVTEHVDAVTEEISDAVKAQTKTEDAQKVEPKPVVVPEVTQEQPEAEEASFFDKLKSMGDNLPLVGGLLGIIGLIAAWLFLRNKRRKDLESFERGILTSGGLRANTVFGNTTGNASTTDTSFLTDFAQTSDGNSMMDTNEVDPIAEAEVYMAYGRETQAEEILKDAIKKEPKRYELHLKLLEIYADRKDTSAFEAVAGELYTSVGSEDDVWKKVAEMGKTLEPSNPLYSQDKPDPVIAEVADEVATDEQTETVKPTATDVPVLDSVIKPIATKVDDAVDVVQDSAKGISGKAAAMTAAATAAAATAATKGVSRIESIVKHEPVADVDNVVESSNEKDVVKAGDNEDNSINFTTDKPDVASESPALTTDSNFEISKITEEDADINIDFSSDVSADVENDEEAKAFDLTGISLDLEDNNSASDGESNVAQESGLGAVPTLDDSMESALNAEEPVAEGNENEVEIKLNLVAAYIDMDDKEGARELLEEVLKEGNDDQVMRAQMMKDSIA